MKYISNKFKVNPKTLLVGSIALMISLSAFAQTTYRWQQGGSASSWDDAGNWGGSVVYNNANTYSFYQNATRLTNFLGGSNKTIGTLNFEEGASADVTIRTASTATGTGSRQLAMSSTNPTINIEAGASGNFTIGDGPGTIAFVNGDLNVVHNGSGNLLLNPTNIGATGAGSTRGLQLSGTGTLQIGGGANYTGNTQINGGTFQLVDGGFMTFEIGASGVNTQIIGAAGTNALFDGEFVFRLDSASTNVGSSWDIFTGAGSLSTGSNFAVRDFVNAGSGIWTQDIGGGNAFSFSESTGVLSVVPEPTTTVLFISLGVAVFAIFRRRKVA